MSTLQKYTMNGMWGDYGLCLCIKIKKIGIK